MAWVYRMVARGLTLGRFAATPVFLYLLVQTLEDRELQHLIALSVLYVAIALSDLLDGFFARLAGASSQRWARLDALSDILFNTLSLFTAAWFGRVGLWVPLGIVVLAAVFAHRNRRVAALGTGRLSEDRLGKAAGVVYYLFVGAMVSSLWFNTVLGPIVIWWLGNLIFLYTAAVVVRNLKARRELRGKSPGPRPPHWD